MYMYMYICVKAGLSVRPTEIANVPKPIKQEQNHNITSTALAAEAGCIHSIHNAVIIIVAGTCMWQIFVLIS